MAIAILTTTMFSATFAMSLTLHSAIAASICSSKSGACVQSNQFATTKNGNEAVTGGIGTSANYKNGLNGASSPPCPLLKPTAHVGNRVVDGC
jgi:hypothetical protein